MRLAFAPLVIALAASAPASPTLRLNCDVRTVYDGQSRRSARVVLLGSNSWREADAGQPPSEHCASKTQEGYRCSLTPKAFEASVGVGGDEPSIIRIDLKTGRYVDRGYMDGKPIKTSGTCRRS